MREALYEACESWQDKNIKDFNVRAVLELRSPTFYDMNEHNLRRFFTELFSFEFNPQTKLPIRFDLDEIHDIEHFINIKLDESWQEYIQHHYGVEIKKLMNQ